MWSLHVHPLPVWVFSKFIVGVNVSVSGCPLSVLALQDTVNLSRVYVVSYPVTAGFTPTLNQITRNKWMDGIY